MEKAGLKDSTEALIMAAQDQAISTKSIKGRGLSQQRGPKTQAVQKCLQDSPAYRSKVLEDGRQPRARVCFKVSAFYKAVLQHHFC